MKARVVILTPFFRPIMGGVESNAERLAHYFDGLGFGVTVLTKHITRDLPEQEPLGRGTVVRIGPYGPRAPGAKWAMLPAVVGWLTRHSDKYDVVCSIDCRGVGLGALAARAVTSRPVIAQPQTTGVLRPDAGSGVYRQGAGRIVGHLYGQSDAVACIARTIEREALSIGVPRPRVHFLPNAIDMTRFTPPTAEQRLAERRRRGVVDDNRVVFVFVGRLSREKGLMDLMEAWRQARPANATLLVAGPDMDGHAWNVGPAARTFAHEHSLEDSVTFLGQTTDVAALMHAADVAVQPSHFEALGLSAIEAMACGVPVIASGVGGLLDFVDDGVNGLTCAPQNPEALAAAITTLARDASMRVRLATKARSSVETAYDEREVFGRFADLVQALAERRR